MYGAFCSRRGTVVSNVDRKQQHASIPLLPPARCLHPYQPPSPLNTNHPQQESLTGEYSDLIPSLTAMARSTVRELDPLNDLEFLRIRTVKHEIMVAPKDEFVLIVIQDPSVAQ